MRLQLIALALLLAARASAEPAAALSLRSGVYQDSDRTFISTSTVAMRGLVKDRVTLQARYLLDVVSSASVDVISSATKTRFLDLRHEAMAGAGYRDSERSIGASYIYSRENDWSSHTGTLSISHDLAQHSVVLSFGGAFGYNDVGRRDDPNFHRRLLTGNASASVSIVASPRDLVDVNYTTGYLDGYQASPYRFLRSADGIGTAETVPDTRWRNALTLRWNRHLFRDTALRTHVRGYVDDWQIAAGTFGVEYLIGFGDLTLGIHARGYGQRHAGFYQPVYPTRAQYMTSDKEASSFIDGFAGLSLAFRRGVRGLDSIWVEAKADAFGFWFFDFPRLQSRAGVVAELAFGLGI